MPPVGLLLLLGPPLLGGVIATAGVLVSLHATTVRQAQQTFGRRVRGSVDWSDFWKQHAAHGLEGMVRADPPYLVPG